MKSVFMMLFLLLGLVQPGWALDFSGSDQLALRNFKAAFKFCERGLQVEMPQSFGSLRVLQSLWRKYQTNRDNALNLDASLKENTTLKYNGNFLTNSTFAEAYRICEEDLPDKIAEAQEEIERKRTARRSRQKQQQALLEALLKKINASKEYVNLAVNQHCLKYLRNKTTPEKLYQDYQAAKEKALNIYPDIVKRFHEATVVDPDFGDEEQVTRPIHAWFKYCDENFAKGLGKEHNLSILSISEIQAANPSGTPMGDKLIDSYQINRPLTSFDTNANVSPPPSKTPVPKIATTTLNDPTFESLKQKITGDKLKVLKQEGRLPDFNDDDDFELNKASRWQYEYEQEGGIRCTTYTFDGNQLTNTQKTSGECPPFF